MVERSPGARPVRPQQLVLALYPANKRQDFVLLQQHIEQAEAAELLRLQAQRKREEAAALEAQAAQGKKR